MSRFHEYLRLGNYRAAFSEALKEKDPLRRVRLISEVIARSYREEYLPALLDSLSEITTPKERAAGESYVGRAFYSLELEKEGEEHFERAFELLRRIPSPVGRGEVLTLIGKNLVLSGRYTDGLKAFREAHELFQSSRGLYSKTVSNLILLARAVKESAEEIPNEMALQFYSLAKEIYESMNFKLQAKEIGERMKLAEEVFKRGAGAIAELLEKGEADKALQMARFLPPAERAVAMLNVSYWLFIHDMDDLARAVFDDGVEILLVGKMKVNEQEVEAVAYKFLRIGKVKEALILAGLLKDEKRVSELIGEIALFHAKRSDVEQAVELAERISNILTKDKVLKAIREIGSSKETHREASSAVMPVEDGSEEAPHG